MNCPAEDVYAQTRAPSSPENASADPEDTGGLWDLLELAEGAQVMLRVNLDVADGLVNGACGKVVDFHLDEATQKAVALWVRFERGGRRWAAVHGCTAVRIELATRAFMGKDGERVERRQFPLTLAWAKTIHKSQGATEPHGIVTQLNAAANQPGMAYVALSRCRRLQDVHLLAVEPNCITAAQGVDRALLTLLLQQAHAAVTQPPKWKALFQPTRAVADLKTALEASPLPPWELRATAVRQAREAAIRGDEPDHHCPHCGLGLFGEAALERHLRTCAQRPRRARRRPAAALG